MARSRKTKPREALSPERIEDAAIGLIEQEGLEGFSFRKLAAELGCEAMSIYHYFPSKAHLFEAVFDRVIGGLPPPDPALPWRERLKRSILDYRAMAHRYPRFFQFIALHRHNTRIGLAWLEGVLCTLRESGLDTETVGRYFRAIGYYIVGGMLDETSGYAKGPSAMEPIPADEMIRDYPEVVAVNPYFQPAARDATFHLGLDILLDRLEAIAGLGEETGGGDAAPPRERQAPRVRRASPQARSSRSSSR